MARYRDYSYDQEMFLPVSLLAEGWAPWSRCLPISGTPFGAKRRSTFSGSCSAW